MVQAGAETELIFKPAGKETMETIEAVGTTETNGTRVFCPVPECRKPYKNNAGLSSHMAMKHKMNLNGEPLPEGTIEKQKGNLSKSLKTFREHSREAKAKVSKVREITRSGQDITYLRNPEIRKKAGISIRRNSLMKLAARGIHRCPECLDLKPSRKTDYPTSQQLGTHRRAEHDVPGVQHQKTAQRSAQLRLEREAAGKKPLGRPSTKYIPQLPFKCELCPSDKPRTFKSQHGLSIHVAQAHKVSTETALPPLTHSKELVQHGSTSTQTSTQQSNGHEAATRRGHHDDASLTEALAIAHGIGFFENYVGAATLRDDLAPRKFAQRLLIALAKHYQTER
jgi:hypothetical protein